MKTNIARSGLLLWALLIFGCVNMQLQFRINVDSINGSLDDKNSYILLPGNKDTNVEDLQFKEYAAYVNRALIKQGFAPAESVEKANVAIFLVYGIGDPQAHQFSYSLPVWGQTGVSSATTYGTSNTYGTLNKYGNYGTYSGSTTSSSTTRYTPTYGIKGYTSHIGTMVTYFRFMVLDAIDLDEYKATRKEVQLWKTTVTSTGSSGDLRRVFPILVGAAQEHIGKNTGHQVQVDLYEDDSRVIEIVGITKTDKKPQ